MIPRISKIPNFISETIDISKKNQQFKTSQRIGRTPWDQNPIKAMVLSRADAKTQCFKDKNSHLSAGFPADEFIFRIVICGVNGLLGFLRHWQCLQSLLGHTVDTMIPGHSINP